MKINTKFFRPKENAINILGIYFIIILIFDLRPETTKMSNFFFMLFLASTLYLIFVQRKLNINYFFVWNYLFGVSLLMGILYAPNKDYALMVTTTYILLSAFFYLVYRVLDEKLNIDRAIKFLMVAGIFHSLHAFYHYGIDGILNSLMMGTRLGWEISAPNSFGHYAATTAILILYYFMFTNKKRYLLLSVLPLIIMITSYSKKAFLVFVISILLLVIFKYRKHGLKLIVNIVIVLIILYSILQIPALSFLNARLNSMLFVVTNNTNTSEFVDGSDQIRSQLIKDGLKFFSESPIMGHGTGSYRFVMSQRYGNEIASHNSFIELLVNNGLIGFLVYYIPITILIISLFIYALKYNDHSSYLLFVLLLINSLIHGMSAITYTEKFFWIIFSLSGAFYISVIKRNTSPETI